MQTKERWQELCDQASSEQDSKKLAALIKEIQRLLQENRDRLRKAKDLPNES